MNWSDEKYVKLYVRDSLTWRAWPWQAKALWPLILRKLDGAGLLETGNLEPADAVSLQTDIPAEVVRPGLAAIIASGALKSVAGGLVAPSFVDAQEARKTEAQKKRDQRERVRDQRISAQVTEIRHVPVPTMSPTVPTASPDVPRCPPPAQPSPSPAQPSPARKEEAPLPREPPVAAFEINPPDLETIDSWTKEDFWKAAEITRRTAGFPPQKWPSPVALSRWWAEARQVADTRELADAFVKFTEAKHWREKATPPCPWNSFASQYLDFLPSKGAA